MVGGSLEICEKIRPDKACFDRTFAVCKARYMAASENFLKLVYNLLERLYVPRRLKVVFDKGCAGEG